jgi:cytochrome c
MLRLYLWTAVETYSLNLKKKAFAKYINNGGGWVGIHGAPTAELNWDWFDGLIGTRFKGHPWVQKGTVIVKKPRHPITKNLQKSWTRSDEWYFWTRPVKNVKVLLEIGETRWHGDAIVQSSTRSGKIPEEGSPESIIAKHPIAWCHKYDGGRVFYSAMCHFEDSVIEPEIAQLLINAIHWTAKNNL